MGCSTVATAWRVMLSTAACIYPKDISHGLGVIEGRHMDELGWVELVWIGLGWPGLVWCGVVWPGVVWCGVVWCGLVW